MTPFSLLFRAGNALLVCAVVATSALAGIGGTSIPSEVVRRIDTADARRILTHLSSD
jgi:hypothetical protein